MSNKIFGIPGTQITGTDIVDGSIVNADLADGAVTSAKILDGTIITTDLTPSIVTSLGKADTALQPAAIIAAAQTIFVDKNGNDTTGVGSANKPYLTITKALQSITDAATGKRYVIKISAGTYTETTIALKPYIYLVGDTFGASRISVTGAGTNITINPTTGAGTFDSSARTGLFNLYLTGTTGINLDFTSFASASAVVDLASVSCNGSVNIKGRSLGADILQITDLVSIGSVTVQNAQASIRNSIIAANVIIDDSINTGGVTVDFAENIVAGNLTVTYNGNAIITTTVTASRIDGNATVTGASATLKYDAVSYPAGTLSSVSSGVLTQLSKANAINANRSATNYTAATGDIKAHLDGIDTALGGMGGGLTAVVDDTTPQLGGDLDLNGHVITGLEIGTDVEAHTAALSDLSNRWTPATPTASSSLIWREGSNNGFNYVELITDNSIASNASLTLPSNLGSGTIALTSQLSSYQPVDSELTAIAGLTSAADKVPYFTGSGTAAVADFTSTARSLLDDTSTGAMRTTLGLQIGTDVQAFDSHTVKNNVTTTYTKQQNFAIGSGLTSTGGHIAWNVDTDQSAKHTATEDTILDAPSNMVDGGTYIFRWTNHASSPKTLTFNSAFKWPGGVAPTVTATNGAIDIFSFTSDGTNMYGVASLAFA